MKAKKSSALVLTKQEGGDDVVDLIEVEDLLEHLDILVEREDDEEILCYCPFHEMDGEPHNPSFTINKETKVWVCRSQCGGGNAITLVARLKNIDNIEALKWLKKLAKHQQVEEELEQEKRIQRKKKQKEGFQERIERQSKKRSRKDYWELKRALKGLMVWGSQMIFASRFKMQRELADDLDLEAARAAKYLAESDKLDPKDYWKFVTDGVLDYLAFELEWEHYLYRDWESRISKVEAYLFRYRKGEDINLDRVSRFLRRAPRSLIKKIRKLEEKHQCE